MALEISSVASADRLRVQRDQATERALAQQREEAVARNRQAERFTEDRQRADAAARDLTQSRFQRDFVRSIDDDQRFDASRELAVKDARLDERVARDVADQRQLYADERVDAADQRFADQSAQPLKSGFSWTAIERNCRSSDEQQMCFSVQTGNAGFDKKWDRQSTTT